MIKVLACYEYADSDGAIRLSGHAILELSGYYVTSETVATVVECIKKELINPKVKECGWSSTGDVILRSLLKLDD